MRYECDECGVAACDLPDGVDPEFIFEGDGKGVYCQGCSQNKPDARHGPDHLKRQHDGRHLCECDCSACYDNSTNDLDEICTCPDCPCVDSDHTMPARALKEGR